ncbi:hypothetical protein; putative exported protein [Xenorhabdus bovienii str. Jollieti]|uniref:N-acetyltransferase domain-containing protein n=2 Tax=Xenorhabdus bovienii TaxID=40576 RepID=D3V2F0_XENBS|nr:hypothetical protein; putative exported protein [Xenorhabdus bovienii SS-2004]CDH30607.1 hypothetical protein; putative exported protein [Xenorhabdus bovienii str. Jollieti]
MFRSKSFINRSLSFNSLPLSQSTSNIEKTVYSVNTLITVKKVSAEEAVKAIDIILTKNMMEEWSFCDFHDQLDVQHDVNQKKWRERYMNSHHIFHNIKDHAEDYMKKAKSNDDRLFFIVYFGSVPIGGLQLSLKNLSESNLIFPKLPEVEYIVTHCGIRNCGIILMEQAVNESQQLNMGGKLMLYPLPDAVPAYLKMGFTKQNGTYLYLDPSESSVWHIVNGCYKYKKC